MNFGAVRQIISRIPKKETKNSGIFKINHDEEYSGNTFQGVTSSFTISYPTALFPEFQKRCEPRSEEIYSEIKYFQYCKIISRILEDTAR